MSLTLVTPPAVEPVRLADLKARLQLSGDAHDGRLAQLIRTARERVERETGRDGRVGRGLICECHFALRHEDAYMRVSEAQ